MPNGSQREGKDRPAESLFPSKPAALHILSTPGSKASGKSRMKGAVPQNQGTVPGLPVSSSRHNPRFPTKKASLGPEGGDGGAEAPRCNMMLEEASLAATWYLGLRGCSQQREHCKAGGSGSSFDPSQEQPIPRLLQSPPPPPGPASRNHTKTWHRRDVASQPPACLSHPLRLRGRDFISLHKLSLAKRAQTSASPSGAP